MLERLTDGRQGPLPMRSALRRQILTAVAGNLVIWTAAVHQPAGAEGLLDSLIKWRAADDFLPPERRHLTYRSLQAVTRLLPVSRSNRV
jgi:hypothetical protein